MRGSALLDYANARLFGPLGIVDPPWLTAETGTQRGGFGLSLTSREMARFGELYRNRGAWEGTQIVPAAWADASVTPRCDTDWGMQYAYHWWLPGIPGFFGSIGAFGQQIFIDRDRGLVVVFTANLPSEQASTIFSGLITDYVLPALE